MPPIYLAAALRRERDGCNGLRVESEVVADGTLLALLNLGTADRCCRKALMPQLKGLHTYMTTLPGAPLPGVG